MQELSVTHILLELSNTMNETNYLVMIEHFALFITKAQKFVLFIVVHFLRQLKQVIFHLYLVCFNCFTSQTICLTLSNTVQKSWYLSEN